MDKKLQKIIDELWLLKYRNLRAYDVAEGGVSKFLIVATAISVTDNKKNAQELASRLKYDQKIDGIHKGEWIIFDLDEIVLQLFASGFREKYNIDKLYKGKEIQFTKTENKSQNRKNKV